MRCTTIVTEQALDQFETLHALCRQGLQKAQDSNNPALVSYTHAVHWQDALHVLQRMDSDADKCFFWSAEQGRFSLVGWGEAFSFDGQGAQRYKTIAAAWHRVLHHAVIENSYN